MNLVQTIVFGLALALAAGAELWLVPAGHGAAGWWNHVPGFFAFFGFFICLALAFFAKWLGKCWLQRDERYYQRGKENHD